MQVVALLRSELDAAVRLLAEACAFDRAAAVADEKLFVAGPTSRPRAFGVRLDGELVGVAALAGRWLRLLAVAPTVRGRGIGTMLLEACERSARDDGEQQLRALDEPGNYLAPGVDARNVDTIDWLERRGWRRIGERRCNVAIAVRDNPRVTAERAREVAADAAARGYVVRRARNDERALLDAVAHEFGGAWPFELARALEHSPPGVHVATEGDNYCAFAAHDGNNRGLGWFGPTGTWPAHRGKGLGEALLLACLVDVGAEHERCEVAWIGPRPFYDKVAGIVDERSFVQLARELPPR